MNFQSKPILSLCGVLLLGTACSVKQLEPGRTHYGSLHRQKIEVEIPGTPRLLLEAGNLSEICEDSNRMPNIRIVGSNLERNLHAEVYCSRDQKFLIARFRDKLPRGEYQVIINSSGLRRPLSGVFVYRPDDPEHFSGPDRHFQAAQTLSEGVNEGVVNPSAADRTDWWVIDVSDFSRYSVVFSQDSHPNESSLSVFRLRDGKLESVRDLVEDRPATLAMQGEYFFRVRGNLYGRESRYHIALRNLGGGRPVSRNESFSILDGWPIHQSKSALLIKGGSRDGLSVGQLLKVFNQNQNRLIETCELVSVAESEAECHLPGDLPPLASIEARRSL